MKNSGRIRKHLAALAGSLLMLAPSAVLADRAYAWADQPAKQDYRPNAAYSSNAAGGIIVKRQARGRYQVLFQKFGRNQNGSHVQVGAYGGITICNVQNWNHLPPDFTVNIYCFNHNGQAADSRFVVEASFPDPGPGASAGQLLQIMPNLQILEQTGASQPSQPVKRRVLDDGRVEIVYSDGTIVVRGPGGEEITYPDGRVEVRAYFTGAPSATPPAPPSGSDLARFLNDHSARLLDAIRALVGGDAESVDNYLARENEPNLYNQIRKRSLVIGELLR